MSEENMEIVRRVMKITQEALPRGDFGGGFDKAVHEGVIASNVEWRAGTARAWGPGDEDFVGRAGWVELMRRWTEDFDDLRLDGEEIIDADNDRVVGVTRMHGTGKGSRVTVETRFGVVYTLKGGRIVRAEIFAKPNHARRAAGLRE